MPNLSEIVFGIVLVVRHRFSLPKAHLVLENVILSGVDTEKIVKAGI